MDGKPSFGKRNKRSHEMCRRCGKHAMHTTRRICAACGFGQTSKIKTFLWKTQRSVINRVRRH